MTNEYYNHGGYPAYEAPGDSTSARAEFDSITTGLNKLPSLSGFGKSIVRVNAAGTALESVAPSTVGFPTNLGSVAGTNVITATASPTLLSYAPNQQFFFAAAGANTASVTVAIDGLAALALHRPDGSALQPSDIPGADYRCLIVIRATDAVLLNPYNEVTAAVYSAAAKATPVSADLLLLVDSAASFGVKSLSWAANITALETVFDARYAPIQYLSAGTRAPFNQTAAPTGWTKDTAAALNDTAMRIVTGAVGSGGANAFSTAAYTPTITSTISGTTGGHALSVAELAVHNHSYASVNASSTFTAGGVTALTSTVGSTTGDAGSGTAHTHPLSAANAPISSGSSSITLSLKYNDFIIAVKN